MLPWAKLESNNDKENIVEVDPFLHPMIAKDHWNVIHLEHAGKRKMGTQAQWGEKFPWLEIETGVPEVRKIGPRVRCNYCYKNKPKALPTIASGRKFRPKLNPKPENRDVIRPKAVTKRGRMSRAEGRPLKGLLIRQLEDHALSNFHSEQFKEEASEILKRRAAKSNKVLKQKRQVPLSEGFSRAGIIREDNCLRNFIRSCIIGAHVKASPRQTFALIASGLLADGPQSPIYGYNNRSEAAIVQVQIFAAFVLRARLMKMINEAHVVGLFSDAAKFCDCQLLVFGVHIIING